MGIHLYRIDDRLIHGQVVVGWGQPLNIRFLVLVDDLVASSDWEKDLYRMAVPPEMEIYFADVVTAIRNHAQYASDPRPGILITGDISSMQRLVREVKAIGTSPGRPRREASLRFSHARGRAPAPRPRGRWGRGDGAGRPLGAREAALRSARGRIAMILLEALPIALLGALLGLDVVSFPQAMVSRPIVAATLAGSLVGNPPAGLLIGVVLEMIALDTLPFGASRYPEWGSAAVVGGALFAAQPAGMPGALPASTLAALLTASISGWSMVVLRRTIAGRLERSRDRIEDGSRDALLSLHLSGMSLDLLRGGLVTLIAMMIFGSLVRAIVAVWGSDSAPSHAVVVVVAATVAGGALWKVFHSVRWVLWFFFGGLLGWAALLVTR
ncbi:MAG: hypothetical protein DMD30_08725 [Gemmatimonadetes bacterium]|nr:MAG: hypothetical protein DMD30_08725 [Gemmatimonadota bacterium]